MPPPVPRPLDIDVDPGAITQDEMYDQLQRDRSAAQARAVNGIDGNPDDAARALQLSSAIPGLDPEAAYGNLDEVDATARREFTKQIVGHSQTLIDYVNAHGLNSTISNDDWGSLGKFLDTVGKIGSRTSPVPTTPLLLRALGAAPPSVQEGASAAANAFYQSIDTKHLFQFDPTEVKQFQQFEQQHPYLALPEELGATGIRTGQSVLNLMGAIGAATIYGSAGLYHGVTGQDIDTKADNLLSAVTDPGLYVAMGIPELEPVARAMFGAAGTRLGMGKLRESMRQQMKAVLEKSRDGEPIPYGTSKITDVQHEQNLSDGLKDLDDMISQVQSNKTGMRAKDIPGVDPLKWLVEHKNNPEIGISADGAMLLYPKDERPSPGDGKLGDFPGMAEKVEMAREFGTDVGVPLAELKSIDPEVYKQIRGSIRLDPNGPTLDEEADRKALGQELPPDVRKIAIQEELPEDQGITALHASPHSFSRFSSDKRGLGASGAAFSDGIYTTENTAVGQSYFENFSRDPRYLMVGGREIPVPRGGRGQVWHKLPVEEQAARYITPFLRDFHPADAIDKAIRNAEDDAREIPGSRQTYTNIARQLREWRAAGIDTGKAYIYKVHIHRPREHFIDWDKKLDEQSPYVQERLRQIPGLMEEPRPALGTLRWGQVAPEVYDLTDPEGNILGTVGKTALDRYATRDHTGKVVQQFDTLQEARKDLEDRAREEFDIRERERANPTGAQISDRMERMMLREGHPVERAGPEASRRLNEAGIAGMQYLDAGSRTKPTPADISHAERDIRERQRDIDDWQKVIDKFEPMVEGEGPLGGQYAEGAIRNARTYMEEAQKALDQSQKHLDNLHKLARGEGTRNVVVYNPDDIAIAGKASGDYFQEALDRLRETSGLELHRARRPTAAVSGQSQNIIPRLATGGQDVVTKSVTAKSTFTFKLGDVMPKLNFNMLAPNNMELSEFIRKQIMNEVSHIDVHATSDADMDKLIGSAYGGYFRPGTATEKPYIAVRERYVNGTVSQATQNHVMIHEALHAVTDQVLRSNPRLRGLVRKAMDEMEARIKADIAKGGVEYGQKTKIAPDAFRHMFDYAFTNEYEWLSEGWSNQLFREHLSRFDISKDLAKELDLPQARPTMWDFARGMIKELYDRAFGRKLNSTQLDAIFRITEEIADQNKTYRQQGRREVAGLMPIGQPEVRGIVSPLEPEAAGLTAQVDAQYRERIAQRDAKDFEKVKDRLRAQVAQQLTDQWNKAKKDVEKEARRNVELRPDVAAERFYAENNMLGLKVKGRVRLRRGDIPRDLINRIPSDYISDVGHHPDDFAGNFGFQTGRQMLEAIADLNDERQTAGLTRRSHYSAMADALTDRMMRERYGDLNARIDAAVMQHALDENQLSLLHTDIMRDALAAGVDKANVISRADLERGAKMRFDRVPIRQHSSKRYLNHAGKTAEKIRNALLVDDFRKAYQLEQVHYKQIYMSKLAAQLERRMSVDTRRFKRLAKQRVLKMPENMTNGIHVLLQRGGMVLKRGNMDLQQRIQALKGRGVGPASASFEDFARWLEDHLHLPMNFDDVIYSDKSWPSMKDMTPDEYDAWSNTIKSIEKMGRLQDKVIQGSKQHALDDWIGASTQQLTNSWGQKVRPYHPKGIKAVPGFMSHLTHRLLQLESVMNKADLGDERGIHNTTISYAASDAINLLSVWIKDHSEEFQKLDRFNTSNAYMSQKVENPGLFRRPSNRDDVIDMDKEMLRGVILYLGTKSGENVLIRGWLLPKEYKQGDYVAAKAQLYKWLQDVSNKSDWDFAEGWWKVNEKIFRKYENMVEEIGGVPAKREELNPIEMHGKKYEGGYHRLIYDSTEPGVSKKLLGMETDTYDSMGHSNFSRASTPRSHEKDRTGYAGPLYLRLNLHPAAMTNVLRDAAVRPFMINTGKIFYNHEWRQAFLSTMGEQADAMLDPYLKAMSGMGIQMTRSGRMMDNFIEYFRRNTIARLVGMSLKTASKHGLSVLVNTIGEVGLKRTSTEYYHMEDRDDIAPNMSNRQAIHMLSHEVRRRKQAAIETLGGAFEYIRRGRSMRDWWAEKGSALTAFLDLQSAEPTWAGAYKAEMERQARELDPSDWDQGLAIQLGDRAVRRAHGSTAVSSRPEAMRASAIGRTWVSLFQFWDTMLQRNYEAWWRTKRLGQVANEQGLARGTREVMTISKLLFMANIAPAIIEELIDPYPKHDQDSWAMWWAKTMGLGVSAMIPGLREAIHLWVTGGGTVGGMTETMLAPFTDVLRDVEKGSQMMSNQNGGKTIKDFNSLFSELSGWSNDEVGRLAKTGWDMSMPSKETPHTPGEVVHDVIFGRPRERRTR